MSAEQFVFWLRGYLSAGNDNPANLTRGDWKAVMEMLKVVVSSQADADVRLLAQKRLYQERDAFLRELDMREQGQVVATTSCTGGPIL